MKFLFNRDGILENVELERWAWIAIYKDGSLSQFDSNEMAAFDQNIEPAGTFHQFQEIDQNRIEELIMFNTQDHKKSVALVVPNGGQVFHYYDNYCYNVGTPQETRTRVYVFGFKFKGQAYYNYILPNDKIVQSIGEIEINNVKI